MRKISPLLPILALIPWIACNEQAGSRAAQGGDSQGQFPSQAPEQEPTLQAMEGILTKVDPNGKKIWIKTADGSESMFSYSDMTVVTGGVSTVEGLGKVSGSRVSIRYTNSGEGNAAEEIEILSKQQTQNPAGTGENKGPY